MGFNIFALIWFLNIYTYPPALASPQTYCVHLVSISKIPPRCPSTTSCVHLASISKLPPRCPSATSWESFDFISGSPVASPHFLACIHFLNLGFPPSSLHNFLHAFVIWVQCLGFTRHLSATYCAHLVLISNFLFPQCAFSTACIHLVSYVGFPPLASLQLLAFMLFSISELLLHPSASQQLPACIGFQYLCFPSRSTTSRAHLVSISNFPSMCLSSNFINFLHSWGFNIYALQGVQRPSPCDTLGFPPPSHFCPLLLNFYFSHLFRPFSYAGLNLVSTCVEVPHLGAFIWFQYLNFPPWCLSAISCIHSLGLKTSPLASWTTFCMHLNLVSMSRLPPLSLNNFLRSSGFNI